MEDVRQLAGMTDVVIVAVVVVIFGAAFGIAVGDVFVGLVSKVVEIGGDLSVGVMVDG